jgi:hypothetical protein
MFRCGKNNRVRFLVVRERAKLRAQEKMLQKRERDLATVDERYLAMKEGEK